MKEKAALTCGFSVLLLLPVAPAFAHPGHGDGLVAGLLHPLLGVDHLLAILAIGLWAYLAVRSSWSTGVAFLLAMTIGAAFGLIGFALPFGEIGVVGSMVAAGVLAGFLITVRPAAAGLLAAAFAVFHGNVHGLEAPVAADPLLYTMGILVSTAMLLCAGAALGRLSTHIDVRWLRLTGLGIAATGGWLLIT